LVDNIRWNDVKEINQIKNELKELIRFYSEIKVLYDDVRIP